jgi:hypothetical protein
MRRFLVLLMLLMLPIRGLVGDAMAYSMVPLTPTKTQNQAASPRHITPENIANYSISTSENIEKNGVITNVKPPCHTDSTSTEYTNTEPQQCNTCEVCHLSVAVALVYGQNKVHSPTQPTVQSASAWHSAEPRLIAKTPIV